MKYLLDSNVFIQAKNSYYSFDFCPAFWNYLKHFAAHINDGLSIIQIKDELLNGEDELSEWISSLPAKYFITSPQDEFRKIVNYVDTINVSRAGKDKFLDSGDPWLIAAAMKDQCIIVTEEISAQQSTTKVKIPDICRAFHVSYIRTFDLLRQEKANFIMG